jgi:hypothetical protein
MERSSSKTGRLATFSPTWYQGVKTAVAEAAFPDPDNRMVANIETVCSHPVSQPPRRSVEARAHPGGAAAGVRRGQLALPGPASASSCW